MTTTQHPTETVPRTGARRDVGADAAAAHPARAAGRSARLGPLDRALAGFSFALGSAQLAAPGALGRAIGVGDGPVARVIHRAVGAREIGAGVAILTERPPARALWSRVAGDVADLALLTTAAFTSTTAPRSRRARALVTTAFVAGVTALDAVAATGATRRARGSAGGSLRTERSITINRPPDDVYRFWRELTNLPSFMRHLRSVEPVGDGLTHWVAAAPGGTSVEWDAETIDDVPGQRIAWRSVGSTNVPNSGLVRFTAAPAGQGTELTVALEFHPPAGALGVTVAQLFGEDPGQQLADDLRRCKQVLEAGEVLRSDAAPDGTETRRQLVQRAARPGGPEGGVGL